MLKLDDHFESYMCPYVCFLHTYDLHVYDPKHVYDAHICAFRHMTHIYDPLSRCDECFLDLYVISPTHVVCDIVPFYYI